MGSKELIATTGYRETVTDISALIATARHEAARSINSVITATYWTIGRRLVEQEQRGARRAGYGDELIKHLSAELTTRFGRGFGKSNLAQMKAFFLAYPDLIDPMAPTGPSSAKTFQTASGKLLETIKIIGERLRLPWSHYVRLLGLRNVLAREFYEVEAVRGGWTVRQLERQIDSQFYERTMLSRKKIAMLRKGQRAMPADAVTAEEELKDPYMLEFLSLKDEYSEGDLEEALIRELETFLLELGNGFTFVGRQRRLRVGDEWYRIDLLLFHRKLRCLVIIDLKLGKFTHADAGQMHLYLNYAREHWMFTDENPPVGLILCAAKNDAVVKYALEALPNKVVAAEYRTNLPTERLLATTVARARNQIESRFTTRRRRRTLGE